MDKKNKISLVKRNVIYSPRQREILFHSVVTCPDGIIRMYANRWNYEFTTVCRESKDGTCFGNEINALKDSGASHNFYTFIGNDGRQYAIGGIDSWKMQPKWQRKMTFEEFKKQFHERFGEPYTKDEERFKTALDKMKKRPALPHTDGLYLFEILNGKKVVQLSKGPIVTTFHDGFNSALVWGKSTEFDGHLSCVYNKEIQKYILYCRNNVRQGVRFIQYAVSEDLLNWSKFRNIRLEGWDSDVDNYYSPVIMNNGDEFIGFIPYFHKDLKACIRVIESRNGTDWKIRQDLFPEPALLLKGAPKNQKQFVNGIIRKDGKVYIYIHENYLGLRRENPVCIYRYEVEGL